MSYADPDYSKLNQENPHTPEHMGELLVSTWSARARDGKFFSIWRTPSGGTHFLIQYDPRGRYEIGREQIPGDVDPLGWTRRQMRQRYGA